jgi:hypothetical protein
MKHWSNLLAGSARKMNIQNVMVVGADLVSKLYAHVNAVTKKRATLERLSGLHSNEGQLASSSRLTGAESRV